MKVVIPTLSDMHAHYRQRPVVQSLAAHTRRYAGRTLAMPNTTPPIASVVELLAYKQTLDKALPDTDVLLSVKMLRTMKPEDLREMGTGGLASACKIYPEGTTTHSADGVPRDALLEPDKHTWLGDLCDVLQRQGMVLCLHGEMPGVANPLKREPAFLPFVAWVLSRFPKLRVVLEHITTAEAVQFVAAHHGRGARLAATITAHHLVIHLGHLLGSACDDALGYDDGKLHPHLHCWPCAKEPEDRDELLRAATSGLPCFILGSDSAPHLRETKEADCGCAGVFTAPVLPEVLVEVFENAGAIERLDGFVAHYPDQFYGRRPIDGKLTLVKKPWVVPKITSGVVPFLAGRTLRYSLE